MKIEVGQIWEVVDGEWPWVGDGGETSVGTQFIIWTPLINGVYYRIYVYGRVQWISHRFLQAHCRLVSEHAH